MASVCGVEVRHDLLHAVSGGAEADLAAALRLATDYHLLTAHPDTDTYSFSHAILREAVYDDLLPAQRRRWHARIAALLAEHPEWATTDARREIAYHAREAGNHAEALAAGVRAGLAALDADAFAEAYDQLRCAAGLWERVPDPVRLTGIDRSALLAAAASAAHPLGHGAAAVALAEEAARDLGTAGAGRAAALYERLGRYHADGPAAGAALRRGLALATSAPARARLTAALATHAAGWSRLNGAQGYAESALALARGSGHEEALARHALGLAEVLGGRPADGLREMRAALHAYPLGIDPDGELALRRDLGWCLIRCGHAAEAVADSLRGAEAARSRGRGRQAGGLLLCTAAEAAFALGRWTEAEGWLHEAAAGGLRGPRELSLAVLSARLAGARGDGAAAARHLDRARRMLGPDDAPPRARLLVATAAAELAGGAAAVHDGLSAIAGTDEESLAGHLYAIGLRVAADAAERARAHRRPTDAAVALAEDLLDRSRKLADLPEQAAYAAQAAAEAARAHADPAAAGYWRAALQAWEALDQPYDAAYAGLRLGEAMTATPESPEGVLRTAWRRADHLGAAPLRGELEALARAHRLRITLADVPDPVGGPAVSPVGLGLTAREVEVLQRVAAGESNGDIAGALYISTKTASVHVSNILRKLGAANRRDAARAARVLGLVPAVSS
jgi:DNA-binding CsgD family transcriptional regulator